MRTTNPVKATVAAVLLVALALSIWAAFSYQRDMRHARERIATGSEIVQTPCGQIEYAEVGEGPPILAVHGAGGGFDQGIEVLEPLVSSGFRVIAVSRFGYLRTPLPEDASAEAQADAHACLLDALNIQQTAILGASAGAPSSMQFALRHPARTVALILLVPVAHLPRAGGAPSVTAPPGIEFLFETVLRLDFLFWAAPRIAPDTVLRTILATPPELLESAGADERLRVAGMLSQILPVSARRQGLVNDGKVISTLPRYDLERITAPALLLSCEDDLFGTYDIARSSAARIPNARFVGYPTGGHLWVGRQTEVMSEITGFLRVQE